MERLTYGGSVAGVAVGETGILLHPPLPSEDVSIWMKRGCLQNESLADGSAVLMHLERRVIKDQPEAGHPIHPVRGLLGHRPWVLRLRGGSRTADDEEDEDEDRRRCKCEHCISLDSY